MSENPSREIYLDNVTHYYSPNYINEDTDGQLYFNSYRAKYYPVVNNVVTLENVKDVYWLDFIVVILPETPVLYLPHSESAFEIKTSLIRQRTMERYYTVMRSDLVGGSIILSSANIFQHVKVLEKMSFSLNNNEIFDDYLEYVQISPFIINPTRESKICEFSLLQSGIAFIKEITIPVESCSIEKVEILSDNNLLARITGDGLLLSEFDKSYHWSERISEYTERYYRLARPSKLVETANYHITLNYAPAHISALISAYDSAVIKIYFKECPDQVINGYIHYVEDKRGLPRSELYGSCYDGNITGRLPKSVNLSYVSNRWVVEKEMFSRTKSRIFLF